MKLSIITYTVITQENGQKLLDHTFGSLVDQLGPYFETIYFLAGTTKVGDETYYPDGHSVNTYSVQTPNATIVEIGATDARTPPFWKILPWLKRIKPYYSYIKLSNFVYITMPVYSGFLAHILCRILKKPYGLYFGSDWQEVAPYMANWRGLAKYLFAFYVRFSYWAENTAVRHSKFTLVHGQKLQEKFKKLNVPIIETIPMVSISLQHFYERTDTCQGDTIRCLYVGSLVPRKGVHDFIEAFNLLATKGYKIHLQLVGAGDHTYTSQLRSKVTDYHLQDCVEFVGHISNLDTLLACYREADIFILPSKGEGFPRVIYEAMSQGLPVISTNIGTIESVLKHGEQGILVPPGKPEAFAEAVELVTGDSTLRHTLIKNGYHFARQKLGQGKSAMQLVGLINKYLEPNQR